MKRPRGAAATSPPRRGLAVLATVLGLSLTGACTVATGTTATGTSAAPTSTAVETPPEPRTAAPAVTPRATQPTVVEPSQPRPAPTARPSAQASARPSPEPPLRPPPPLEPAPQAVAFARQPVETLLPEIRLDALDGGGIQADAVAAAMATPGVTFATLMSVGPVDVDLPGGRRETLTVAAVDPAGFRVLVPQVTADEPAVWERVVGGGLVLTHEQAAEAKLEPGTSVTTAGGPLRLEALAALGQPPVADAMVDFSLADDLGLGAPRTLLVSVAPEAWPDEVAAQIEAGLGLQATLIYGKPQRTADLPGDTVWDRLAVCESSGDWSANTGNGYYGGLQFLPSSWHLVGGVGLPHEASRDEQILRAELLLQRQGWRAWPVCSVRLGLREPGPGEAPDGRPLRDESRP